MSDPTLTNASTIATAAEIDNILHGMVVERELGRSRVLWDKVSATLRYLRGQDSDTRGSRNCFYTEHTFLVDAFSLLNACMVALSRLYFIDFGL